MTSSIEFSKITSVKVMRDGDGDGKCREENGKFVPCPPGVAAGTSLRNGKPLGQTISDMKPAVAADTPQPKKKPAPKSEQKIDISDKEREMFEMAVSDYANDSWLMDRFFENWAYLEDSELSEERFGPIPQPNDREFETVDEYRKARSEWESRARAAFDKIVEDIRAEGGPAERARRNAPDALNERGLVRQELIDEYMAQRRESAAKVAQRIADAEKQASPEAIKNGEKIARLADDGEKTQDDFEEEYERLHPPPKREYFVNDSAYRSALNIWENRRRGYVYDKWQEYQYSTDASDELEEAFIRAFDHTIISKSGDTYTTKVTGVSRLDESTYAITGVILDDEGREVATFERSFDFATSEVHHDRLFVKSDYQGQGLATLFNAMNEPVYRAMGMDHITVNGVSGRDMSGATHWPSNGFDWDYDKGDREDFIELVMEAVERAPDSFFASPQERLIVQALAQAAYRGEDSVVAGDLVRWKGATQWFKDYGASFNYRRELYYRREL